jgi:molybdopterin molybdotransferase
MITVQIPVLGFAAHSGTGKTTLLEKLIPLLVASGLRVGLIKKSHHDFTIDHPGKDSHRLRQAGATTVLLCSPYRRAIIVEHESRKEPELSEELAQIDHHNLDIILVEGFKDADIPKIELHRTQLDNPLQFPSDPSIIALATDGGQLPDSGMPHLDINNPEQIRDFILANINTMTATDRCYEPMEGKQKNLTLQAALSRILSGVNAITETESVSLMQAKGRILAENLYAGIDLPPFSSSAMDGYALRHADLEPLPGQHPLNIVGSSFAGAPYDSPLHAGECIRIMTGASVPPGADTVVPQEDTKRNDRSLTLIRAIKPGANIRHPGDDQAKGACLIEAGKTLTPADLGLIASNGSQNIIVKRKLRVAYFSTGDELSGLGAPLTHGQIYDSNRYILHALLDEPDVDGIDMGVVRDTPEALKQALRSASEQADVIITTGGVSVGDADHIVDVLEKAGSIDFWKVAIKPGKPFAFGQVGASWFFGLPGNPVAVMVIFSQLVRPALHKLSGTAPRFAPRLKARCISALKKSPGRVEFQRGILTTTAAGAFEVESTGAQGSNRISSSSRANCYIVLPHECSGVSAGETVEVELIDALLETRISLD